MSTFCAPATRVYPGGFGLLHYLGSRWLSPWNTNCLRRGVFGLAHLFRPDWIAVGQRPFPTKVNSVAKNAKNEAPERWQAPFIDLSTNYECPFSCSVL
jgi:hypothetical protein